MMTEGGYYKALWLGSSEQSKGPKKELGWLA